MKKLLSVLLALVMLLTAAVPFAGALAEDDKVVNIGVTSTLTTLNPLAMDNTEIVKYAVSLVFLPLVELNSDLEFVPQLADSITTEDNLTFTIKLAEDAVWSDGMPVTAEEWSTRWSSARTPSPPTSPWPCTWSRAPTTAA